jgi:hypothetical protein
MGVFDLTPSLQGGQATGNLINGFRLINGEVVLLFSATGPFDRSLQNQVAKYRRRARRTVSVSFDLSPETGPRAMFLEGDPDGHFNIWDLSLV